MDMLFGLGLENEVTDLRDRLRDHFGDLTYGVTRSPIGALVKSIISCRTKDEVSLRAYNRLVNCHAGAPDCRHCPLVSVFKTHRSMTRGRA